MASVPPPALLASAWFPFILNFYWRVVPLAQRFHDLRVSSWFRTPEKNRTEGGRAESQHLFGLAMDLVVPRIQLFPLTASAQVQGLIAVQEGDHVHVQAFPAGALARAGVQFPRG